MKRREFIGIIGGASAWPIMARAQQPLPVIGFLTAYSLDATGQQRLTAFKQGLAEAGFIEGRNVAIEVRWAEGHYDRLPAMAADLVHRQVSVIVTGSTPAARAAKSATANIPIVFNFSSDPVALGLVSSLARPGGNLTGVTRPNVELAPKQLDLIHEIVPAVTTVALLVNPASPEISEPEQERIEAAARTRGLKLHVLKASDERGIDAAFATMLQLQAGALIISPDAFFSDKSAQLGLLSLRHRMPAIFNYRDFVTAGGLMSYSGSLTDS
jgi:putative ABC transport system substrate-binding protein